MTIVAPDPASTAETPGLFGAPGAVGGDGAPAAALAGDAAPRRGHLPYFPAIEGLRGLAVAGVLLYHLGFEWMKGGYLGVSTFFTLSGFLITSLILAERGATAELDLRAFWRRRFRRLMPAALAALALASVFGIFAADAVQQRNLAGDVAAALAYVANWRFLFSGQSYADLFAAPSPVLHFWSLAIEEQFYLVYPMVAWVVLQHYGKRRSWLAGVLGALLVGSLALTLFCGLSKDAIYYNTGSRAAEILVGALLAVGIYHRRVTQLLATNRRWKTSAAAAGTLALVGAVALWCTTPQTADWLYRGGLFGYALLSGLVILAAIIPFGPVRAVLAVKPMRELGKISYGVYLYHWPIFLWLSEERFGWPEPILVPVRLAVTFALAIASYRWLEMPVRRGEKLFRFTPMQLAPVAVAVIVVMAVGVTLTAPKPVIDFDEAAATYAHNVDDATASAPPPQPIDPTAAEPPFPRLAMFGDSTALMTGLGLSEWARETKQSDVVDGTTWLGCGLGRGGERRSGEEQGAIPDHCNHWERTWGQKIANNKPNIAIVQVGPWEVADRKLEGDTVWRALGDPVYDAYLLKEMDLAVDTLSADGADVIWLTSPPVSAAVGEDAMQIRGQAADPARTARLNELIEQLPARKPGRVHVVDLAGWLAGTGEDTRLRPDGVHFGKVESKEVATRWLGQTIVDTFREDWKRRVDTKAPTTVPGTTPGSVPGSVPVPGTIPGAVPDPSPPRPSTTYDGPTRKILVLGDDAAGPVADALESWGRTTGELEVSRSLQPGCGVLPTTSRRNKATVETTPDECSTAVYGWLQTAAAVKPDIVVVVPSVWDLTDVQLTGDDQVRSIGDKPVSDALWTQFTTISDALHKTGAIVGWLNLPSLEWGRADVPPPTSPYPASDPNRAQAYNDLLEKLSVYNAATRATSRIDVAHFARNWPSDQPPLLPDGRTIGADVVETFGTWLGPELLVFFDEHEATAGPGPAT